MSLEVWTTDIYYPGLKFLLPLPLMLRKVFLSFHQNKNRESGLVCLRYLWWNSHRTTPNITIIILPFLRLSHTFIWENVNNECKVNVMQEAYVILLDWIFIQTTNGVLWHTFAVRAHEIYLHLLFTLLQKQCEHNFLSLSLSLFIFHLTFSLTPWRHSFNSNKHNQVKLGCRCSLSLMKNVYVAWSSFPRDRKRWEKQNTLGKCISTQSAKTGSWSQPKGDSLFAWLILTHEAKASHFFFLSMRSQSFF